MLQKIGDKIEDLFTVKQTKYTGKRLIITLGLAILFIFSLPIYFKYEDYAYEKYKQHYQEATQIIIDYYQAYGVYPTGDQIKWDQEKNLNTFFTENNFNKNRRLYYIDLDVLPEIKAKPFTYILDIDHGVLYTREFRVYQNRRWHLAIY